MFSEIVFDTANYPSYKILGSEKSNRLANLSHINIFIGQNNSGKSRFMRSLFADDDFDFLLTKNDSRKLQLGVKRCHEHVQEYFERNYFTDADSFLKRLKQAEENLAYFKKGTLNDIIQALRILLDEFIAKDQFRSAEQQQNIISTRDANTLLDYVKEESNKLKSILDAVFPMNSKFKGFIFLC